jgi:hypothetical protein
MYKEIRNELELELELELGLRVEFVVSIRLMFMQ